MASSSLRAVLTGDFLNRLGNVTSSSLSKTSNQSILSPSSTTNISKSLRIGSRTLTTAYDNLNIVSSVLNLSRESLQALGEVTNELIDITEEGTRSGLSRQQRANLQRRFDKAAGEFNDIFSGAKMNDIEYLDKDSLQQLFEKAGLDSQTSYSIATVFDTFVLSAGDSALASDEIKSGRPISIPIGAYSPGETITKHSLNYTDSFAYDTSSGGVSSYSNLILSEDFNGHSTGDNTMNVTAVEDIETMLAPGLSTDIQLMAVSQEGYTAFISSDDLLGTNAGLDAQIYLSDGQGNVVQQVTLYTNAVVGASNILDVSLSGDGKSVLVEYNDRFGNDNLELYQISSIGDAPGAVTSKLIAQNAIPNDGFQNIKINDAGTQVAYIEKGVSGIELYDVALTTSSNIAVPANNEIYFDFYSTDVLGIVERASGDPVGEGTVHTYDISSTTFNSTIGTLDSVDFSLIEFVENGERLVYGSRALDVVSMKTLGASGTSFSDIGPTFTVDSGDSISSLSAAVRVNSGYTEVGIVINDSSETDVDFLVLENDSDTTFTAREIFNESSKDPFSGYVNSVGTVIETEDERYDYNTTLRSIGFEIEAGQTVSIRKTYQNVLSDGDAFANGGVTNLLAIDSQSGYALIRSNEDFLGYNPLNYENIFVMDAAAKIIGQITTNDGTEKYNFADLTVKGGQVAIGVSTLLNGGKRIDLVSYGDFGDDPSTHTVNTVHTFTGSSIISNVKIEKSGTHLLFSGRDNGAFIATSYTISGGATEQFGTNLGMVAGNYGFIGTNKFATFRQNDSGTFDIVSYNLSTSEYEVLESGVNYISNAYGLFADQMRGSYAIGYNDSGVDQIGFLSGYLTDEVREFYEQSQGDNLKGLSFALKNDGTIYIGAAATLNDRSGDPTVKLHRFEISSQDYNVGENLSTTTKEYDSLFDPDRTILTRPDAYRALADLKALAGQISDNISAIDDAQLTVTENIELVRSLGQAFLQESGQLTSEEEADVVAQRIRKYVTSDIRSALSQAENLESIIVAALTSDPTTLTG